MSSGIAIYNTYKLVKDGVDMINSKPGRYLANRAAAVAEMLQQVESSALLTILGQRIVQALVNSAVWSIEYDNLNYLKRVLNHKKHRQIFGRHHRLISQTLADFAHSITIKSYNTPEPLLFENKLYEHPVDATEDYRDISENSDVPTLNMEQSDDETICEPTYLPDDPNTFTDMDII